MTLTDRELMRQALEALEQYTDVVASGNEPDTWITVVDAGKPARDAITALRERLARPEQEPVAWMNPMNGVIIDAKKKTQIGEGKGYPSFSVPCYTAIQRKPSGGQGI